MLVLEEGLDLNLVDQSLDQLGGRLGERDLFDCHNKFTGIVLSAVDMSESAITEDFAKLEFFEK